MKQLGTWAAACEIDALCGRSPMFASQPRWGAIRNGRQDQYPMMVLLLFSPLILISCIYLWPRMIKVQALARPWTFGQLDSATWQKQWWWGPLSCWLYSQKPLQDLALQIKQVCSGTTPFSWKGLFPNASLPRAQSSVLILLGKCCYVAT